MGPNHDMNLFLKRPLVEIKEHIKKSTATCGFEVGSLQVLLESFEVNLTPFCIKREYNKLL